MINIKLRFLITCDKHRRKSESQLQMWDNECQKWQDVETVECKIEEKESFLYENMKNTM